MSTGRPAGGVPAGTRPVAAVPGTPGRGERQGRARLTPGIALGGVGDGRPGPGQAWAHVARLTPAGTMEMAEAGGGGRLAGDPAGRTAFPAVARGTGAGARARVGGRGSRR